MDGAPEGGHGQLARGGGGQTKRHEAQREASAGGGRRDSDGAMDEAASDGGQGSTQGRQAGRQLPSTQAPLRRPCRAIITVRSVPVSGCRPTIR